MTAFPPNVIGISCPGCQPGDFPQPHICGLTGIPSNQVTGYCSRCQQFWTGFHSCPAVWKTTDTTAPVIPTETSTGASACDHCWCLKQKAGWYDVPTPGPVPTFTLGIPTERRYLKPHLICCNCGNRRVKA